MIEFFCNIRIHQYDGDMNLLYFLSLTLNDSYNKFVLSFDFRVLPYFTRFTSQYYWEISNYFQFFSFEMASTADSFDPNNRSSENSNSKTIKIQSNDGEIFSIDQGVVEQSSTIKTLSDCALNKMNNWFILFFSSMIKSCFIYSDGRWWGSNSITECESIDLRTCQYWK